VRNLKTAKFATPDTSRTKVLPDTVLRRHAHLGVSCNFMIASYPVMFSLRLFLFPFPQYISLFERNSGTKKKTADLELILRLGSKNEATTLDNTSIIDS